MSSYIGQSPVFGDFPSQIIIGNGTATYELTFRVSNENGMLVFLNGAIQRPGVDYTAGGTSLAFADVVATGVQIFAYGMGLPKSMLSTSAGAIGLGELAAGVYANASEAQGLSNNTKLITPKTLDDSFKGANQVIGKPLLQRFPGGLIIQSGIQSLIPANSDVVVTFPFSYIFSDPIVVLGSIYARTSVANYSLQGSPTKTSFTIGNSSEIFNGGCSWMAIGY